MANEITSRLSLIVKQSGVTHQIDTTNRFVGMDPADVGLSGTISVTNVAEAIPIGEIDAGRIAAFQFIGEAGYIDLSMAADASTPFARLRAGGGALAAAVIPINSAVIYAKADAAGRILQFIISEAGA